MFYLFFLYMTFIKKILKISRRKEAQVGQFESRFTTFNRDHSYLINKTKKKSSTRSSLGNMASLW